MARIENKFLLEQYMETSTAEVIAINRETGLEMFLSTLESDELTHDVAQEEIKGGIWNDTLTTINKNKTIKFKVVDPVSRMDVQMNKLGAELKTGNVLAWHFDKAYTVEDSAGKKVVTLDESPVDVRQLTIYNTKTKKVLVETTDYTITGKNVEIKSADILANENVFVGAYQFSKENVVYGDISGKSLPSSYQLIIRKPLFDLNDTVVAYKQYFFPKAKMSGSFSIKGQTEKTKNTEETEFTIEKDLTYDYLGRIMLIPETSEV